MPAANVKLPLRGGGQRAVAPPLAIIDRVVPRLLRLLPALSAFFVLAIALSACGDSVPGDSVAKVDDETITRTEFNHWMGIAQATAQQGQPNAVAAKVYNPPDFTACVAKLRETAPKPAAGQPKPNDLAYKAQCKKEYEGFRNQVLQFLINEKWIRGEAADQGVELTDKQLDAEFNKLRMQSFPKAADFQKFLKDAAQTVEDVKLQVGFNLLSEKLRAKVDKSADKVTNERILDYYNKNKKRFAEAEKRDIRIVLTKTKGKADQAKAALQNGQSWKAVTKKFSIDTGSKANGGSVKGLPKGQQEQALDSAIFSAEKGTLVGPIKTQFGYYVVQVQKIVPATQQSLKKATPAIKQQLQTETQRKARLKFSEDLRKKWKEKTTCREGYITQDCKNSKKEDTTATQAAGQDPNAPQDPNQQQVDPNQQQVDPNQQQVDPNQPQQPPPAQP